ncbi:hypothetical protein MMC19_003302 [Ptychographa xylographoides]|nr:hypothetical protein [Ptychographa xylographoides]
MNDSKNAFVYRYGRRFLRDPTLRYPLPVDLAELHRQTLRTLMLMRIHGAPFCSPFFEDSAPKKVLEVACGSALWSSACHDYFKAHGFPNVSFTGVDIAPLAPDLKAQGLNWRFVQHDCRDTPWPFPDEEFDFLFIKDVGLAYGLSDALADTMRLLKPGGVVEIWESDYLFRTLLPHPTIPPGTTEEQVEQADDTATYIMSPSTAFVDSQNTYLSDYNEWVQKAFDKRHLIALPCSTTSWAFSYSDLIGEMGSRRVAIPFGEVRWEREGVGVGSVQTKGHLRGKSAAIAEKQSNIEAKTLTANQAALRRTALTTTIQLIEALEPLLKVESGKRQDEWDRWWAGMTHDLLEHNGTINGECLELGAWWGRKT